MWEEGDQLHRSLPGSKQVWVGQILVPVPGHNSVLIIWIGGGWFLSAFPASARGSELFQMVLFLYPETVNFEYFLLY